MASRVRTLRFALQRRRRGGRLFLRCDRMWLTLAQLADKHIKQCTKKIARNVAASIPPMTPVPID